MCDKSSPSIGGNSGQKSQIFPFEKDLGFENAIDFANRSYKRHFLIVCCLLVRTTEKQYDSIYYKRTMTDVDGGGGGGGGLGLFFYGIRHSHIYHFDKTYVQRQYGGGGGGRGVGSFIIIIIIISIFLSFFFFSQMKNR